MQTETVHIMDYDELDKLVNETFPGLHFEFADHEEMGNDTDKYFPLILDPPLNSWRQKDLAAFLADPIRANAINRSGTLVLLHALVSKGLILPGNYLIRVSW